ncbi:MAG: HAMP domain-containing protein [Erysipelotrichia bacterium]|nr:HAMP domain-containing protein [Erysipelotrichia bacterium]
MSTEKLSIVSYRFKNLLLWAITTICLVGIPAVLVFVTTARYFSVIEEDLKFEFKMKLQQATNEATRHVNQEKFWCRHFHEKFGEFAAANTSLTHIIHWLERQRQVFDNEFDFIAWDPDGNQKAMTFNSTFSQDEWRKVFYLTNAFFSSPWVFSYKNKIESDIEKVREIIGPQFMRMTFHSLLDSREYSLGWVDSAGRKRPIGAYFVEAGGALLFFDHAKLKQYSGLRHVLKTYARNERNIAIGTLDASDNEFPIWQTGAIIDEKILQPGFDECETKSLNFVELAEHYIGFEFLTPNLRIFACMPRKYNELAILWRATIAAMLYIFLMLPFFSYTWKTLANQLPGRASIRLKLAFLFIFATGIPLLAMVGISQEHYLHKRLSLMTEAQQRSIETLLSFDRRYQSALKNTATYLDKFFIKWARNSAGKELDENMLKDVREQYEKVSAQNFFVIASSSKIVGNSAGLFYYKGEIDVPVFDLKRSKTFRAFFPALESDLTTANLVGKKVMSDLNRVEIPGHTLSKLEIIAESLLQKSFIEITHSLIVNFGYINQWGFGYAKDMTYFKFLSTGNSELTDYLAMFFWQPVHLQSIFIKTAVIQANRNPDGFKLIAHNRLRSSFIPELDSNNLRLETFAKRLGQKPTEEIEILTVNNEQYLAVGFNGRHLDSFQLIGLYPLRNIEMVISQQKSNLFILGIFSILLAAGLAQILAKSFLKPLSALREGALAIEKRDFSHRINETGKDEFGEIASIFNNTMVGFEELEVAKIVQESLFPAPDFAQNRFKIFGKSISMGELGGDYLDFFAVNENSFALLLGDVAGHGVGAALIMAMAKTGILSSGENLASPQTILANLHKLILASKNSRQKKIMTLQYMFINSITCEGLYANAGGCSPYIYRHSLNIVEELKIAGAPLGSFKKATFSDCQIKFNEGDAIIFYTDGIVESRNSNGEEIGYEGLQKILCKSYSTDPQVYYQNILDEYNTHIKAQKAQDDLTIIIMVCMPNGATV